MNVCSSQFDLCSTNITDLIEDLKETIPHTLLYTMIQLEGAVVRVNPAIF